MTDQLETQIRADLDRELGAVGDGPGPLHAVRRNGRRLRRRRLVGGVAAAVVLVVGAGAVTAGVRQTASDPAPAANATWTEAATSPLSPRHSAIAAWTGREMVVVGGGIDPPCPPNASCTVADTYERDGAAYDPATDSWRRIADAPVEVGPGSTLLSVTDDVLVLTNNSDGAPWYAYDLAADRWHELPAPPRRVAAMASASGGLVYTTSRAGTVLTLDPVTDTWAELPRSPLRPALEQISVVATPAGVFVTGYDPRDPDDGDTPSFAVVERWDGERWQRYPATGQVGADWQWTGSRLVALDPQVATGMTGKPPYGGVLDVGDGSWSPLPNAPDLETDDLGDGWSVNADDGPLIARWSSVYDDRTETWTPQGRPSGTGVDSDQVAVWADGELIVFGGLDSSRGYESPDGLSNQTWIRAAGG